MEAVTKSRKVAEHELSKVVGFQVRLVEQGLGSFVFIHFGKELFVRDIRGEWLLWTYMCLWEIQEDNRTLGTSRSSREELLPILKMIEKTTLTNVSVLSATFDAVLEFDHRSYFYLLSYEEEEDDEQWCLFTPEKKVLVAGPKRKLVYEEE